MKQRHGKHNNRSSYILITHNHWIHYKHLLFLALHKLQPNIKIILTAHTSTERLKIPDNTNLEYDAEFLHPGSYETAPHIKCALKLFIRLCQIRPRVTVIAGWNSLPSWSCWLWAQLCRRPVILWAESNSFDHRRYWWKELIKRLFLKGCSLAHVYGVSHREYLCELGFPAENVILKRAVLDVSHFVRVRHIERRDTHRAILYVGRFSPEKNLERLIRAFCSAITQEPQIAMKLNLVGYGPQKETLVELTRQLGLTELVSFMGPFAQSDLPMVYSAADGFILPSVSEPWGLVVNEAMCCELPVMVSKLCGCARDLVTKETGWTFDPLSIDAIRDTILHFSQRSNQELANMGRAGGHLSREYTAENCAKRVIMSIKQGC